MNAYKVEVQLNEDGQLALSGLPFSAGAIVEVIVLEQSRVGGFPNLIPTVAKSQISRETLESATPYRYDDPFEPAVPIEDWDALS